LKLDYKIGKLQRGGGDAGRLAYFRSEAGQQLQRVSNGRPLPLPMALPEISVERIKYTDENGLPVETLMHIGQLMLLNSN
jgi:hypothetical protein